MADRDSIFPRSCGVLMHPTSLPGPYGMGDLGAWAYRFVDILAAAGQTVWQVLPLGPTGFGNSPYQVYSTFAGNSHLIALDGLADQGWIARSDLASQPWFPPHQVDYERAVRYHDDLLTRAYDNFVIRDVPQQKAAFRAWVSDPQQWWLDDFALFMTLKEHHEGRSWTEWPEGEALRDEETLDAMRAMHACRIEEHRWRQWVFATQWNALRTYANGKGIRIVGDIPIYVAHDSSDVWTQPHLFQLDETGQPISIAGVPPDYFSATGQRWGNPLYGWAENKRTGYDWWIKRIKAALNTADIVRIDHFRGFDRYWSIPASEPTAVGGHWVEGPQMDFFEALGKGLGAELDELPLIAEDLGDDLGHALVLRDELNLPGMVILQFAFGASESEQERFLPDAHRENSIVYTGTHDNNTVLGWWWCESSPDDRDRMRQAVDQDEIKQPNWALIEMGMSSPAHTFVALLQDVIGLGASARMNKPGVPSQQWRWRATADELEGADWNRLRALAEAHDRVSEVQPS
jgi:4-alpha-glucanotransferase